MTDVLYLHLVIYTTIRETLIFPKVRETLIFYISIVSFPTSLFEFKYQYFRKNNLVMHFLNALLIKSEWLFF